MKMNAETNSMLHLVSFEAAIMEVYPLENLKGRFSRFGHELFRFSPILLLQLNGYG